MPKSISSYLYQCHMLLIMQGPGDIQEGGSYQSITQRVRFV